MNADFFALAQGRVAEELNNKQSLAQGMEPAAARRGIKTIAQGIASASAIVVATFGMLGTNTAQAQTQEQVLNSRLSDMAGQVVGSYTRSSNGGWDARTLVDQGMRAASGQNVQTGTNVTIGAVAATLVTRLIDPKAKPATYAVAGAIGGGAGYLYNQVTRPSAPSGPQAQYTNGQVGGPAFYNPRDLGMPAKFSEVSQRTRIGLAAPGQAPWDLRDGSQVSNNMVRALQSLEGSLKEHAVSQGYLNESRLSYQPLPPQQQNQINQRFNTTNQYVDRAVETFMRMSNDAALQGMNTTPFNQLAANMIQQQLAPEQQVNQQVNARVNYGYR